MLSAPSWLSWVLAGLFAALAIYSARLATAKRCACEDKVTSGRASSIAHAVMALGMAVMFLPLAAPVPSTAWIVVFLFMAAWFGVELLRARPVAIPGAVPWGSLAVHHLLGAVAMIYVFGSGHSVAGMDHHHGWDDFAGPMIALPLLAYFLVDAGWSMVRVRRAPSAIGTCRSLMGLGMAVMLVPML